MKKSLLIVLISLVCGMTIFKAEGHSNHSSFQHNKSAQCVGLICLLQVKHLADLICENSLTGRIAQEFNHSELINALEVLEYIFPLNTLTRKNTCGLMSPFNSSFYQQLMHDECSFVSGHDVSRQDALRVCDICLLVRDRIEEALACNDIDQEQVAHARLLKKFLTELLDHSSDCFISAYIR